MITTHFVMFHFLLGASNIDAPAAPDTPNVNWLSPFLHCCLAFGLWLGR